MISVVYLILIYGIICVCMIIFNIFAILYGKGSDRISAVKVENYKTKIKEQFDRIADGLWVDENHLKFLKRKLKRGNELVIFDSVVTTYKKRENKYIDYYLDNLKEVFMYLMYYYEKRSNTEMAYYLSVVRDYNLLYNNKSSEIERILFDTLYDESFYCRDNAYLAICKIGNPYKLKDALVTISDSNKFFHKNLIFNGLNIYDGNNDTLNKILVNNFDLFRTDIKCCIIDYLAFYSTEYSDFVFSILTLSNTERSLKISCLRYFEYVHYERAEKLLIAYVDEYFNSDFLFCFTAVKALRNYVSEESISMIKNAIHSNNFKIRDIACESLAVIRLGLNAKDLEEFDLEEDVTDMYNYHVKKNMKKTVK